ncbi:MAG: AIR synthase-related protein [Solirubrobacterales bacterium]|nr:AIR synthase-related protein [Solirubrobacterales bacterium]
MTPVGSSGAGESAYAAAGVDYETLDAGKRLALTAALASSPALDAHGGRANDDSRGEPAFVFELGGRHFSFVVEGLGTKSVIARQVAEETGVNRFADIARDTVAAIVNDLTCVGALPLVVNAYFATGSSGWYGKDGGAWNRALIEGWADACAESGATWGGGESPTLPGMVQEEEIELAGSAIGAIPDGGKPILGEQIADGDEIVFIASNGIHANGSSLARKIASELDQGYRTTLPGGRNFGEALLDPSIIYTGLVRELGKRGIPVTYYSHVTGHGFLKLMRPTRDFTYRITALPEVPEVLGFMVREAGMDDHAAYSTFNMGCGYAVYARPGSSGEICEIAAELGLDAMPAGRVESGPRRVLIEPKDLAFTTGELDLAPETAGGPPRS